MKKIIALLMVLPLLLSICACSSAPAAPTEPSTEPSMETPTETPTEAPTDAPTEAPTAAPTEPPTEAPTEPPTEAPTKAPTEPPTTPPVTTEPAVKTVIDYSRKIVEQGGNTTLTHHYVKCPALTADTADARAINKEIYDIYANAVKTLKNYEEGEYIYLLDYTVAECNGIVTVILLTDIGFHYGGVMSSWSQYYYDTNTGKQLNYSQYLKAFGLTEETVDRWVEANNGKIESDDTILWIAIDPTETHVMLKSDFAMDGYILWTVKKSILNG